VGLHCNDLFALPYEMLFDAARQQAATSRGPMDIPLWTGLRLHALPLLLGQGRPSAPRHLAAPASTPRPLKELETELIRQAVDDARGNVMKAAKALGVSRATVYRRLGPGRRS
jgi:sigma-54 dependent transcriptional regulator, acetoin dehydrogenase operon transcriptional activator AcoR